MYKSKRGSWAKKVFLPIPLMRQIYNSQWLILIIGSNSISTVLERGAGAKYSRQFLWWLRDLQAPPPPGPTLELLFQRASRPGGVQSTRRSEQCTQPQGGVRRSTRRSSSQPTVHWWSTRRSSERPTSRWRSTHLDNNLPPLQLGVLWLRFCVISALFKCDFRRACLTKRPNLLPV